MGMCIGKAKANERQCRGHASHHHTEGGEYSWGPGLRPRRQEGVAPSYGGQYGALSPAVELLPNHLRPTELSREHSDLRYPGERVG